MQEAYWYGMIGGACIVLIGGAIWQSIKAWKEKGVASKSPDGVVDYVLLPQKDQEDLDEVMFFQCGECPKQVTNIEMLSHAVTHGAFHLTVDIQSAKHIYV